MDVLEPHVIAAAPLAKLNRIREQRALRAAPTIGPDAHALDMQALCRPGHRIREKTVFAATPPCKTRIERGQLRAAVT